MKRKLARRVDAAMGRIECDLLLRNARYLDVFSCAWKTGDIAVIDGVIVATDPGLKAKRTIDLSGKTVVPGFIDAHVHIESSLMVPAHFDEAVRTHGTTAAICDPHELANVMGVDGIKFFLDEAERAQTDLRIMLSSCVPATNLETNGGGEIPAKDLVPLRSRIKALGLAEMMNVPGVLHNDAGIHEKLEAFQDSIIDGHCPLLTGRELSAYAATGVSSCHESSRLDEAREKLEKGVAVWIREGSVAKDLAALQPLLTLATSTTLGFCTDDRNPLDIAHEGHLDHLIRSSIKLGTSPEIAYRAASWSVARHYALDRGFDRTGAIAPGYRADLVVLGDAASCAIQTVFVRGIPANELPTTSSAQISFPNTIRAAIPEERDLEGASGRVHVIGVRAGRILTDRHVMNHDAPGVSRLTVLERYGRSGKPANAYATGFGELKGAIASSVGHDSHNLIVVGSNTRDMRAGLAALAKNGGGFVVVRDGAVVAELALPFGGLMTSASNDTIVKKLTELRAASKSIGCQLPEPFLQLAFLSLPVIPSLKLTDKGLVDVDAFKFISVSAA